ncbi:hypothetical protein C8F04DRAFT_1311966 [Mycena alexandri]|uniref:Uncharacterized protein n=1 Tax=Mycena alexandri TaxID=1745969 RepID=A0AAD6S6P8_9AGAR|nr:hypothetical protein C8F04DRAFT_1311966 [Mycena alexandri]
MPGLIAVISGWAMGDGWAAFSLSLRGWIAGNHCTVFFGGRSPSALALRGTPITPTRRDGRTTYDLSCACAASHPGTSRRARVRWHLSARAVPYMIRLQAKRPSVAGWGVYISRPTYAPPASRIAMSPFVSPRVQDPGLPSDPLSPPSYLISKKDEDAVPPPRSLSAG